MMPELDQPESMRNEIYNILSSYLKHITFQGDVQQR